MRFDSKLKKGLTGLVISAALVVATITTEGINVNPHNMKVMPQIQPFIYLYDKDGNREADSAMVGVVGPNGLKVVYDREPTKKEKDWYRNN